MRTAGQALLNAALLFALALWGGMVFFLTFVATPIVFADLDRDAAARLLGDLFPRYFAAQAICIGVALAAVAIRLLWGAAPRRFAGVAAGLLGVALAISLYAGLGLLPRMQEAQARVPSFVTTPKDDPARLAYGKLHGQAMILNAVAALLGGATLVLVACEPRLLARRDERGAEVARPLPETTAIGPADVELLPARARPDAR